MSGTRSSLAPTVSGKGQVPHCALAEEKELLVKASEKRQVTVCFEAAGRKRLMVSRARLGRLS